MTASEAFRPDWASPPGDTIADVLEERDLSLPEFAQRIGNSLEDVQDLLQGRATITLAVARELVRTLGGSVEFWMARDFQYRADMARLQEADREWLTQFPLGDMIKFGWLTPTPHPSDEMAALLRFFNVPSVSAWREEYADLEQLVAFRTSPSFDSRPAAVAAWLRQGEIEAEAIGCSPWDAKRFHDSLPDLRSLTRSKDPRHFLPILQTRCAETGVAAVVVRAPSGCRASGATRFLTPDKALLLLSARHLTDDQFWFTLFHEAGHLLLHGERGLILDTPDMLLTSQEQEANQFAAGALVPTQFQQALLDLPMNHREIIRFARGLGVSPGIVVGQLQHHGRLPYTHLNHLKRRYRWQS
jgi:HTH-type transcriptional regulator / antitoxin HigA